MNNHPGRISNFNAIWEDNCNPLECMVYFYEESVVRYESWAAEANFLTHGTEQEPGPQEVIGQVWGKVESGGTTYVVFIFNYLFNY